MILLLLLFTIFATGIPKLQMFTICGKYGFISAYNGKFGKSLRNTVITLDIVTGLIIISELFLLIN